MVSVNLEIGKEVNAIVAIVTTEKYYQRSAYISWEPGCRTFNAEQLRTELIKIDDTVTTLGIPKTQTFARLAGKPTVSQTTLNVSRTLTSCRLGYQSSFLIRDNSERTN